eukprot:CAMPEP_0114552152 /NCGR_PEP_ID=MMETSP0114-20121206/6976_1 /TAXON_ID=31324 /ORGANISM="Goniomonas sp, Strain m" /LENGTH=1050 /DNA_ID=CAMNT_0001737017 /DNA_START=28 /DNA_END=3180 /DNA_ORIENTATION=+
MRLDAAKTESVPHVAIGHGTGLCKEVEIVDSANIVLCRLNIQDAETLTLAQLRESFKTCGVARLPKHFQFGCASVLVAEEDEACVSISKCFVFPPDDLDGATVFAGRASLPRLALFAHGSELDVPETACDANEQDCFGRTPLHHACEQGASDMVAQLLTAGASVWRNDHRGQNPLHISAAGGHLQVVQRLMEHALAHDEQSARNLLNRPDSAGRVALLLALQHKRLEVATYLMGLGAEMHHVDRHGGTIPSLLRKFGLDLSSAVGSSNMELVTLHLSLGAQPRPEPPSYRTELHDAAEKGVVGPLSALASAWGATGRDAQGQSPLHLAAAHGHTEACRVLLASGADLAAVDKKGRTPLHRAVAFPDTVTALLESCAQVGPQCLDSLLCVADHEGSTPLHAAAAGGSVTVVEQLLEANADVDGRTATPTRRGPSVQSPLSVAYIASKTAVVNALLSAGASTACTGASNLLRVAATRGDESFVQALLASPNVGESLKEGNEGLLAEATSEQHTSVALLLLAAGWNPFEPHPRLHRSAFEEAARLNNEDLAVSFAASASPSQVRHALCVAAEADAPLAAAALLALAGEGAVAEAFAGAGRAGASSCVSSLSNTCREHSWPVFMGALRLVPLVAGGGAGVQECAASSPFMLCLHKAPRVGGGAAASAYEATALSLLHEGVRENLALMLIRSACSKGHSASFLAASKGFWNLLSEIIRIDPSACNVVDPATHDTPLHLAILGGPEAAHAVTLLLEAGADVLAKNRAGMCALTLAKHHHNTTAAQAVKARLMSLKETMLALVPDEVPVCRCAQMPEIEGPKANGVSTAVKPKELSGPCEEDLAMEALCDTNVVDACANGLAPCGFCGRSFAPDRVAKHRNVCQERPTNKKPKDTSAARVLPDTRQPQAAPAPPPPRDEAVPEGSTDSQEAFKACNVCGRWFYPAVLARHQALAACAPRPTPTVTFDTSSDEPAMEPGAQESATEAQESATASASASASVAGLVLLPDGRAQCRVCSRGFALQRLDKHESVCKAAASRARPSVTPRTHASATPRSHA